MFSGTYPIGCGFIFDIYDTGYEQMYHANLRVNTKNSYKQLAQSFKLGTWQTNMASYEDMNLKEGNNSVEVKVDKEYFRIWINGEKFKDSIPVDSDRLLKYSYINLVQNISCGSFDLDTSFVEYPSKFC